MDRAQGHSFLCGGLGPGATVVDLGMNRGLFARHVIDRYGCRVVGVEPVPDLYDRLPRREGLVAERCAISGSQGEGHLHLNESSCATLMAGLAEVSASRVSVRAVTLDAFIARHGLAAVALLKVDIEGAEIDMLLGVQADTLATVDQISVEFHDFVDDEFKSGVRAVDHRLKESGFRRLSFSLDNSDVLYINESRLALPWWQYIYIAVRWRYLAGLVRKLRRAVARVRRPTGRRMRE